MKGARLQSRQLELAQPFADRSFGDSDREPPGYLVTQIDTAPTDHFVILGIRTFDRQFPQFRHLRLSQ